MLAKRITSLQHPNIKHWIELRKSRDYRVQAKSVLITGEKTIREFPFPLLCLVTQEPSDITAQEKFIVPEEILKKITALEEPDGFAAEVLLPPPQEIIDQNFVLILDQIQDPGNLGTLLRSALAFGWEGIIATPGTVDLFNDKALRAAQGATFRLPYCWKDPDQIAYWLEYKKRDLWVADLQGDSIESLTPRPPLALVLSSEGKGTSPWSKHLGRPIVIPMDNQVESLNVASAGAILLYSLKRPL